MFGKVHATEIGSMKSHSDVYQNDISLTMTSPRVQPIRAGMPGALTEHDLVQAH